MLSVRTLTHGAVGLTRGALGVARHPVGTVRHTAARLVALAPRPGRDEAPGPVSSHDPAHDQDREPTGASTSEPVPGGDVVPGTDTPYMPPAPGEEDPMEPAEPPVPEEPSDPEPERDLAPPVPAPHMSPEVAREVAGELDDDPPGHEPPQPGTARLADPADVKAIRKEARRAARASEPRVRE